MIQIGGRTYELLHEHKNAWNLEAFKGRYSDVLERYDYIIGDWGYNQLRLKGFFKEGHPKATKESTIANLADYINEYCNFGCAYFVLQKTSSGKVADGDAVLINLDEEQEEQLFQQPNHYRSRRQSSELEAAPLTTAAARETEDQAFTSAREGESSGRPGRSREPRHGGQRYGAREGGQPGRSRDRQGGRDSGASAGAKEGRDREGKANRPQQGSGQGTPAQEHKPRQRYRGREGRQGQEHQKGKGSPQSPEQQVQGGRAGGNRQPGSEQGRRQQHQAGAGTPGSEQSRPPRQKPEGRQADAQGRPQQARQGTPGEQGGSAVQRGQGGQE
ncbi:DUF1027 domain-containing protein [Paenibacillus sambharensis]|uniref:DUF1027 domain-containing protein n=1 Tax=Paenibacillus sambharensis TaxID=1803190 RepID=A0A2W1L8N1_9BACL|nr:YutD-like domain-containing protein [Paenibacillus sambharensis]PZD95606.1 DUF1027 domain-containing protein [Paenibacillus sambharensis]